MARTGRRRGGGDTRQAIAGAARRQFAERGYEATTIRGIAAEAGVDPALVMHFFGSKDALFAECVQWPFDPDETVPMLLSGKRSQVGQRLEAHDVADDPEPDQLRGGQARAQLGVVDA